MGSHKKQPISDMVTDSLIAFFSCVGCFVTQNKTFPQVGPLAASCVVVMGTKHSKCWTKYVTIEMLTGVIIGLLGGVIFSEFLCERAIDFAGLDYDDSFFSKVSVGIQIPYRTYGLCWGPLVGGVIGSLI